MKGFMTGPRTYSEVPFWFEELDCSSRLEHGVLGSRTINRAIDCSSYDIVLYLVYIFENIDIIDEK